MDYKNLVAERIKENTELEVDLIEKLIEIPPKKEMGDYAFPCFQLAKTFRKAPNLIAEELKEKINKEGFEKVVTVGPYLNFFVDKTILIKDVLEKVLSEKEKYGSSKVGEGKNVVVEYSSPNIAKPFHIGHLFTTAIGNALYKILSFEGYNCIGINHLGDWGTQFGKLISAYRRWVDEEALEKDAIGELLRIYVKFHEEAEKDPELEKEARLNFKNLEDGSKEETELWNRFKDLSLKEFNKVYDMLGIKFDSLAGESFYSDKMDAVVQEIDDKGLLVDSNGAKVVMLDEYNMPPCMIKKSDGATIYATRDLAAAIYRKKTYDFHKCIYVVGTPQALHFKQVFTTLKLMGHDWADDCKHVGFGLVKLANKKLSTRNGDVVFLEDLLNQSVEETLKIINEKNPNLKNKEDVAKKLGIGAVVFTYLKNNRERDIVFDWKEILSFDGETGPYVEYSYARGKSILRKAGELTGEADYSKLSSKEEFELAKLLGGFNDAIMNAIDKLEPAMVTRYIIEVAKAFNKFYNAHGILNAEDNDVKLARVKLVEATCQVIKNALNLLGIDVVEEM
ncbi:arginine--tRNA ligase [Clostridium botulinum]|uniref:Arginine--tRNA ligase n=1 Tax=Clostridium botulinum (strain Langeland / NCTC 10281 / Type F) TaxID=441772 RepID=SYR_CLOBL|nr:arginine--tRNA ligase [Clostridium botulinum]A7GCB9.1 RecName: Full=Arginine--tRNA ligase; AltName: Full=Arginyl-tRNA synthetase; Short=ArgRS [Clostridium botulinum F str. Langeland]ABS40420.1 arginine--tRNA ligase [Clostridium botulinum F str. Langeland]ADF98893.1 arginine--tRNA ligase [Clostridium botulinum F str. 230613]KKM39833.1 arginyl-tRNA synthetase [Clostridium botulinum]MBD5643554.1 arginine--tRNA ligase [Clostridium botulinum]MBY6792155.1 arginine--tRNA ligase [Clostridium botul